MPIGVPIAPSRRLESLDVLRGVTIAGMLLVNNPGTWDAAYPPLLHAEWNGWTLTDLVFPFFLFMVGMAMMYSFPRRMEAGDSPRTLFLHVARRSLALMVLGWWGATWSTMLWPGSESVLTRPDAGAAAMTGGIVLRAGYVALVLSAVVLLAGTRHLRAWLAALAAGAVLFLGGAIAVGFDDPLLGAVAGVRLPGVLVRIGACYLIASAIWFAAPGARSVAKWIVGLLAAYFVFMLWVPVPGFGAPDLSMGFPTADTPLDRLFSNWAFYLDHHVLGSHTWSFRQLHDAVGTLVWSFDPEGIVSTIPAVGSVLFGILAGLWMRRTDRDDAQKLNGLFVAGVWLLLAGQVLSIWMPINKNLWTSSYTVFTAGMALVCLAALFHLVDMKGRRRWAVPFRAYGRNAIFAFVLSGMMATALGHLTVRDASWKDASYEALAAVSGDATLASFIWALLFVALWAAVAWWMDRRGIYFKV